MNRTYKLAILLCLSLLIGCSLTPTYTRPEMSLPSSYVGESKGDSETTREEWWKNFESNELNLIIQEALEENHDLKGGAYRVEQARAMLEKVSSSLYPKLNATGDAARSRTNGTDTAISYSTQLQSGALLSYEIDFFGKNKANVEAQEASVFSSEADQDSLELITISDTAQAYFTVLNLRKRQKILENNLDVARQLLKIVNSRFKAGREAALAVAQQTSSVASIEANLIAIRTQKTNAETALAFLLGKPLSKLEVQGNNLDDIKIPTVDPGQPASLLERRPDIRAAEYILIGASADIGAAKAAFLPTVTVGLSANVATAGWGDPSTTISSLLSSLSAPIFRGGELRGELKRVEARHAELIEKYFQTILVALKEVEDALASSKNSGLREEALRVAFFEAKKSYDLSRKLYGAGRIDFQDLLTQQNTLLIAENTYEQVRLERLSASVALYKAIGGEWV